MFIYSFTQIARPCEEVERLLVDPQRWLPGYVQSACEQAEEIRPTVGLDRAVWTTKEVLVRVGEARRSDGVTSLPFTLEVTGGPRLVPRIEADLEIAPLGPGMTQLTLRGTYRGAPPETTDHPVDRLLRHAVAEALAKSLVERIEARLRRAAA